MRRHLVLFLALLPVCAIDAAPAVTAFATATYVEIVKDVATVAGSTGKESPAKPGEVFTSSDLVRSGRGSRAQLKMPDETLIRVGPNAVFSLNKSSRQLHLESGSILFFAPPGVGGGVITTDSVSCAVTGTTILVSKDKKKGNKLQVLEGECRITIIATGQVILLSSGKSAELAPGGSAPTLGSFSAATMTGAILVSGFNSPLPSAAKVSLALGGLPSASPADLAAGIDSGSTADAPPATPPSPPPAGATTPNLGVTASNPERVIISPSGEGQVN